METFLQLHEFFIEGTDSQKSHVLLNVTEPSTPEEKLKGYFFAICEISNSDNKYIVKLQELIDEIENNYYEITDQEDKTALEIVLDKINQQTFSLSKDNIKLDCVVGVIRQTEIIFTFCGQPQILLFYKNRLEQYKKIDLVEENKNTNEETDKQHLFPQIIQGRISDHDYLFVGTSHLTDYFSQDRLEKIISSRPPRQSAEHLERVLKELRSNLSFGGVIIHLQKQSVNQNSNKTNPTKKGGSLKSLTNLFNTEKTTAHILSPSLFPRINKITSKFKNNFLEQNNNHSRPDTIPDKNQPITEINSTHLRARQTPSLPNKPTYSIDWQTILKNIANISWLILKYFAYAIKWLTISIITLLSAIGKNIILVFFVIINYKNRRRNILNDWSHAWLNFKQNIKQLPLSVKLMVILSILLAIVLVVSIIVIKNRQTTQAENKLFTSTIQEIANEKDAAESAIIYNDNASALNYLQTAKQKLLSLNCEIKGRQETCQKSNQQVEDILKKIRKIYTAKAQLLTDWSQNTTNQLQNIFIINKKIFGFNSQDSNLALYDLISKKAGTVSPSISTGGFASTAVPKENDYAVLIYENNKLAQYKSDSNNWEKIDISYPNQNSKINALFVYNRRLYDIDTANNQIYRHDTIKTGFGAGSEWLINNSGVDLKNAISLAIDGDLYTLDKNGVIKKFTSGQEKTFAISGLDPKLESANALWTYFELNYIYILDGKNKRLIILDKEGALKKQLTANEFSNPTSMVIDEVNDTGYILDSNKLYQIELGLK